MMAIMAAKSEDFLEIEDHPKSEETGNMPPENSYSELDDIVEESEEPIKVENVKQNQNQLDTPEARYADDVGDDEDEEEELKAIAEEAERRYREEGEPDLGDIYEQYEDGDEDEYDEDCEDEEPDVDYSDGDEDADIINSGRSHIYRLDYMRNKYPGGCVNNCLFVIKFCTDDYA